jgi:hypothetical protein
MSGSRLLIKNNMVGQEEEATIKKKYFNTRTTT